MNQQANKTKANPAAQAQAGAKIAAGAANKMTQSAFIAAESTQKAAQNVFGIGAGAVREIFGSGSGEAQKAHEKIWEMSREGVENIARSADSCTRLWMEMIGICRDNIEAAIECCTITSGVAKNMSEEIAEVSNRSFSESVEISKEAFNCRTLNDVLELQNRALKQTIDTCFDESSKLFGMAFDCCTEALEPINERVSDASEKLCKALAA